MYRILVMGMADEVGGIERVIKSYYDNFDLNKIHLDFICAFPDDMAFETELTKKESKVFHIIQRNKNPFKYSKQLKSIFFDYGKQYDCLWFNTSDLANVDALKLAKKVGIKRIIIHSHNSKMIDQGTKGWIKTKLHYFHRKSIQKNGTDYWACSKAAEKWLYPLSLRKDVIIVKNAIDINRNSFNNEKRKKLKEKLGLTDQLIIGNVGRLNVQKNQFFLLKIFQKIKEEKCNVSLVIVGEGPDREKIEKEINKLGLDGKVMLVGQQKDMQAWYSLFDIFVFPSVFEGLSVALLEAQANGLSVITSDKVSPAEVKVNPNFQALSLNDNINVWKDKIEKELSICKRIKAKDIIRNFDNHGYNIAKEAKILEEKFLSNSK